MTQVKEYHVTNGNRKFANKSEIESEEASEELKTVTKLLKYLIFTATLAVIITKLYFSYRGRFLDTLFPKQLLRYDWVEAAGQEYFSYKWSRSVTPILKPVLPLLKPAACGVAVTLFSWIIVYFDSRTPGLNPPSPFSKVKQRYGYTPVASVHLGYAMAILSGVLVFILMLFCDFM